MPYPHFTMYDFEDIIAQMDEHPTDNFSIYEDIRP